MSAPDDTAAKAGEGGRAAGEAVGGGATGAGAGGGASGVPVRVSTHYQGYTRAGMVTAHVAPGATVDAALDDLNRQFPGMKFRLVDEQGRLRQHVNVFVGLDATRDLATPIPAGATLHILGSLSGG